MFLQDQITTLQNEIEHMARDSTDPSLLDAKAHPKRSLRGQGFVEVDLRNEAQSSSVIRRRLTSGCSSCIGKFTTWLLPETTSQTVQRVSSAIQRPKASRVPTQSQSEPMNDTARTWTMSSWLLPDHLKQNQNPLGAKPLFGM